jgi:hypothetical protein
MRIFHCLVIGITIVSSSRDLLAESPSEIYQRLVIPLIQSSKASSCSECHFQGVKLNDFLTSDPSASFASLRARGWIDVKRPSESKLLEFIAKEPEHSTTMMDQVRKSELEAIGKWIHASVADPESLNAPLPKLNDLVLDEKLIRHGRRDHVLSRFIDVVWSQFERCANCHSPDRNAKQVEKHGERMSWIVPNSPWETLQLLEERKLIHLEKPTASLLKTKALGQDKHGGGVKFPFDGQTDREWGKFLEDYAAIRRGRYVKSIEIPAFESIRTWRTGLHLRIQDLPSLPPGQYAVIWMQRIHPDGSLDSEPIAIGEGRISMDGTTWGTSIMLLEPAVQRNTRSPVAWETLLSEGRYKLSWVVVESSRRSLEEILAMKPTRQIEIDSLWKSGHSHAKTIAFREFKSSDADK